MSNSDQVPLGSALVWLPGSGSALKPMRIHNTVKQSRDAFKKNSFSPVINHWSVKKIVMQAGTSCCPACSSLLERARVRYRYLLCFIRYYTEYKVLSSFIACPFYLGWKGRAELLGRVGGRRASDQGQVYGLRVCLTSRMHSAAT